MLNHKTRSVMHIKQAVRKQLSMFTNIFIMLMSRGNENLYINHISCVLSCFKK